MTANLDYSHKLTDNTRMTLCKILEIIDIVLENSNEET